MTAITWCYKKCGKDRYVVPSIFEDKYSAWILIKPETGSFSHKYAAVSLAGRCIELSVGHLKKGYGIKTVEFDFDPVTLYDLLLSKILVLQNLFNRLYVPCQKIYGHEVWFSDFLLLTLQKSLLEDNNTHLDRIETGTPFSLSICEDRVILNTKKELPINGYTKKSFRYAADSASPYSHILKVTSDGAGEEFDREWEIYNCIMTIAKMEGAPEGILVPHSLLTIEGKKIIYLPIGKPYVHIPLSAAKEKIAHSLIKGLLFLHSECLVHGDPKLENVTFIDGKAKLFDFGYTVPFGTSLEHCYTDGHQAPEYFLEKKRDMVLLDIYALGATLYEIAYGKRLPYTYSRFKTESKSHLDWIKTPSNSPLIAIIKGFTHPHKERRMSLENALSLLESHLPIQAS